MKKLFCVLTVVCMLASLVCVSALAGPDEHDEQILVAINPTATSADQTGKITVWSGNVGRDFSTDNTMAVIDVDELTAAIRNDVLVLNASSIFIFIVSVPSPAQTG